MRHELVRTVDYIRRPKASGYRGIHLIYSYVSDKTPTYNGFLIEMQIRSRLQHAWATAVETVGTFTSQALKSSAGDAEWLRFFILMSSAIALEEDRPLVPQTEDVPLSELRELADRLRVTERLNAYNHALRIIEQGALWPTRQRERWLLLELDPSDMSLQMTGFANATAAAAMYDAAEGLARNTGSDVVLVRADSVDALRRAYPNYFADTRVFVETLRRYVF